MITLETEERLNMQNRFLELVGRKTYFQNIYPKL